MSDGDYTKWDDNDSRLLLMLLNKYQENFSPDLPQTVPAIAEDLAQSMDETKDKDEYLMQEICKAWGFDPWPGERR